MRLLIFCAGWLRPVSDWGIIQFFIHTRGLSTTLLHALDETPYLWHNPTQQAQHSHTPMISLRTQPVPYRLLDAQDTLVGRHLLRRVRGNDNNPLHCALMFYNTPGQIAPICVQIR